MSRFARGGRVPGEGDRPDLRRNPVPAGQADRRRMTRGGVTSACRRVGTFLQASYDQIILQGSQGLNAATHSWDRAWD